MCIGSWFLTQHLCPNLTSVAGVVLSLLCLDCAWTRLPQWVKFLIGKLSYGITQWKEVIEACTGPLGITRLVILPRYPLSWGSDKRKCESFLNPGLGACNWKDHSYHLFSVKNGFHFNAECLANTVDAKMCPICSAVRNSDVMVAHFPSGSIRNWECSCHTGLKFPGFMGFLLLVYNRASHLMYYCNTFKLLFSLE